MPLPPSTATRLTRSIALVFAMTAALSAGGLLLTVGAEDGFDTLDVVRTVLIMVTTAWLAWGASLALAGLWPSRAVSVPPSTGPAPRTVMLVPICNEDPVSTFARIAAIDRSLAASGASVDIAILSDTRDPHASAKERAAFVRLRKAVTGQGELFYRIRENGAGRKAGNVGDFMRNSGRAYDLAVILDADSLMSGEAIRMMIDRMVADPQLGLLQTLPRLVEGHSLFARAMQFSAAFHGLVFTRGLMRMQGNTGPFWGHNAIVRVEAFAQSCGLPDLPGKAPFGGHILSHDYVEAALLARAGWRVQVDSAIPGSYEEGPENVLSYARRDRRWCQGNLQHARLLAAPGLAGWSRFVFLQGIMAYVAAPLWGLFLLATLASTVMAPLPDYFPEAYQLFPTFPYDSTLEITTLILGTASLLVLPKFLIWIEAIATGRAQAFGGSWRSFLSMLVEIALTSVLAPIMLAFQTRAVVQVLSGQDGGWPANARGEGRLSVAQSLRASGWIVGVGLGAWGLVYLLAPNLMPWLLPIGIPMTLAPVIIAWSSRPLTHKLFRTPEERDAPQVLQDFRHIMAQWQPAAAPLPADRIDPVAPARA
ncbi:membrane glycosyltransferase [Sagittula marina]|uniref:Glucans biosynthesis glucosyltransferase H n=1 Tax=Sagittula marina TaxID=943940 RepID=A0A7W6DVH9_9RHOB|nr:glucans biosynthesis glucosyltransferase MdoH [Sagittula marina]MBB3987375.1 membrane glycosyltransferase [Sagittula marina]